MVAPDVRRKKLVDKVGIDFHGVISAAPELFAAFCHAIRQRGVEVYVITGGSKKDIETYLQKYRIEYDKVWAVLDFYEQQGKVEFFDDGSFKVEPLLWNKAKAEYCAAENIQFHIDDSNVYGRYFVTPYCKYDIGSGVCKLNGLTVDFCDAQRAAKDVVDFIRRSEGVFQRQENDELQR